MFLVYQFKDQKSIYFILKCAIINTEMIKILNKRLEARELFFVWVSFLFIMLKLNKKNFNLSLLVLGLGFCVWGLSLNSALALDGSYRQVKTADNPDVYFLSHSNQRKKVYLNEESYLNYGNKWSDIKIVQQYELDNWLDAKLLRVMGTSNVYYIEGSQKTLIKSLTDLSSFGLSGEPILNASAIDLNQYSTVSYEEIGFLSQGSLVVEGVNIYNSNDTLLTNTSGNHIASFKLRAPSQPATIDSISVNISGIYNDDILKDASIRDENNNDFKANVMLNKNTRIALISFWEPLVIGAGGEKTINLYLDLGTCSCSNQVLKAEIRNADSIQSDQTISGSFPIVAKEFGVFSGSEYIGAAKIQEQSIADENSSNNGSRVIGKYVISETTGNEDFYLKDITFSSQGSVSWNDWEDFRLLKDGEVLARVNDTSDYSRIKFNVNYCRIDKNSSAELTVLAGLKEDYNTEATVNLQAQSMWTVGKVYSFSLPNNIINIDEIITLN